MGCSDWGAEDDKNSNTQAPLATPYRAQLTCGLNGRHTLLVACFSSSSLSTELELRNGQSYGLYKPFEIPRLGHETERGFTMDLNQNFELQVQNASDSLVLGVRILNIRSGQLLFEKQVGQFGVITVSD
jgi:hypothetical protein